ncbi:MAG: DUF2059 domain-containing protein [Verrucomicrobiaceae bacterium]|nr:MAG: DUF2059 domain-containing protein [Verrucomicrobiaceae bacterium]
MKRPLLLLLISASAIFAQEAEPSAEALTAARELTKTLGLEKQNESGLATMAPMIENLAKRLQLDEKDSNALRETYKEWYTKDLDQAKLREEVTKLYALNFTTAELKEINEFYLSPIGAKMVNAMPEIMQKSAALGMQEAQSKQALLQARLQPFIQKNAARLQQPAPGQTPAPAPAPGQ